MHAYFDQLERVGYEGANTTNALAFRHYNPQEVILGKTMAEHLRFAACYWHTFCWNGADMFGVGAFDRPWQKNGDALQLAKLKADVRSSSFTNSTCLITASMMSMCHRKVIRCAATRKTWR